MNNASGKKIAILGATSHIAKGLIYAFSREERGALFLFARSPEAAAAFMDTHGSTRRPLIRTFDDFSSGTYDVIINCVGIGEPQKLRENIGTIFRLTETFDNLILDYLTGHRDTLYINFSSGAAYGTDFSRPTDTDSRSTWNINRLTEEEFYGIAKLHAEAKHRALKNYNIVDLRIFGYFSRFINLESRYLLTEIISCIRDRREFITGPDDIVRDYVHPQDLASLVVCCITKHALNDVFDVYSRTPVTKVQLLEYFKVTYNLRYRVNSDFQSSTATGVKNYYCSSNKKAEKLGYAPEFTSLECIAQESIFILHKV